MKKINKITAILLATISIIFLFSACSAGNNANVELTTFANATTTSDKSGTIVAESIPADKASTTAKGSTSTTAQSTSQNGSTATTDTTKKQNKSTSSAAKTSKKLGKQSTTAAKATKKANTTKKANAPPKSKKVCYITIECKSILKHLGDLKPGHEKYVPSDGYLLRRYRCTYKSGDTAYDILKRSCAAQHIKITAEDTKYGVYIAGINNIDEKDCGKESGWLYKVNGTYPSITCGKQNVKPNDEILFTYTCDY